VDSRNATVGSISKDNIIGKLIFRVWPISGLGPIH
jgi:signal peptidase I